MVLVFKAGQLEELFAELSSVEDPVGFLGDSVKPLVIIEARLHTENFFEEDILTEGLNLLLKSRVITITVDGINATNLCTRGEHFPTSHPADLLEDWVKIFVLS